MSYLYTSTKRTGMLALLVSLIFGLALTSSAQADEPAIPQAPVLSVIAASETLPFTLAGGGDVQVAVLEEGEGLGDAEWVTTSALALAPYLNEKIRALLGEISPLAGQLEVKVSAATVAQTDRSRLDYPVSALDVASLGSLAVCPDGSAPAGANVPGPASL